jgi:NAD(P)-dependent dehydrogenase (short-subunit alcohol dehydrogenase family)
MAGPGRAVSVIGRREPSTEDRALQGVRHWACDILDEERLPAVVHEIVAASGPLNHVAFYQRFRGSGSSWSGELEAGLTGTKRLIDAAAESFAPAGDRTIVLVSSVIGRSVMPSQSLGYHVAKAGMESMVRYYAVKLGPRGIRVNGVAPATVVKEESSDFYQNHPELTGLIEKITPLRRMCTAEDVAEVIAFLCSSASAFLTAQVVVLDGGLSAVWQEALARSVAGIV